MPSSLHNAARTYACALNNMGVAMMLHGRFSLAVETLRDALTVMLRHKEGGKSNLCCFAQERAQVAAGLLSEMSSTFASSQQQQQQQQVLGVVESNDIQSLENATRRWRTGTPATPSALFYAVLIREPCTALFEDSPIHFDRESGTILYNYGLACHMLSCFQQQQQQQQQSLGNSQQQQQRDNNSMQQSYQLSLDTIRSLVLAHTTFSNLLFECDDYEAMDDAESVFLALLVLSCASDIFRARNEISKADEADDAVDTLLACLNEDSSSSSPLSSDLLLSDVADQVKANAAAA